MRASTLKLIGVICAALTLMITLIVFIPTYGNGTDTTVAKTDVTYNYDKVKTASDVTTFLKQFGWDTEEEPIECGSVTIPSEFDKIFASYNEIQKAQGLNLTKYRSKEVTRYTFAVTNYPNYDGTVYANVLVYRNKVIGGDICSADPTGFIHGLEG